MYTSSVRFEEIVIDRLISEHRKIYLTINHALINSETNIYMDKWFLTLFDFIDNYNLWILLGNGRISTAIHLML